MTGLIVDDKHTDDSLYGGTVSRNWPFAFHVLQYTPWQCTFDCLASFHHLKLLSDTVIMTYYFNALYYRFSVVVIVWYDVK